MQRAHYSIAGHLNEIELRISKLETPLISNLKLLSKIILETISGHWERRKQSVSALNDTDYFSAICKMPSPQILDSTTYFVKTED